MTVPRHPSLFALDRAALGELPGPELARHLAGCETCRSYLDGRVPAEPPAWVERHRRVAPARRRWRVGAVASFAAAAAVLVLLVRSTPPQTRPKATPVIAVHVQRGDRVSLWDGSTPIRADDRLQLQVGRAGFRHVSVASLPESGNGPARVLYAGPLPATDPCWLPLSLRVDAAGSREILSVVLGVRSVEPAAHDPSAGPREEGFWRTELVLNKEKP